MAKKAEAAFQDAVVEYAQTKRWLVMAISPSTVRHNRTITNMRYDGVGWPDLTCIKGDRIVFIECKRKGVRKISPDQQKWQRAIIALEVVNPGIEYHVLNPIDWDLIERIFA
jgi:hypothetical protein